MPAVRLNNSATRWDPVPWPAVAEVSVVGLALARAMNSASVRAGDELGTTMTVGYCTTSDTGVKSAIDHFRIVPRVGIGGDPLPSIRRCQRCLLITRVLRRPTGCAGILPEDSCRGDASPLRRLERLQPSGLHPSPARDFPEVHPREA